MTKQQLMRYLRKAIPNTPDAGILNAPVTLKALISVLEATGVLGVEVADKVLDPLAELRELEGEPEDDGPQGGGSIRA
jgi:hypothetical protein